MTAGFVMVRRTLTLVFATFSLLAPEVGGAYAAPTVRAMYVDAMAREQAVRAALSDERGPASVLKAVRTVVADYEMVVRHYPASGYSDNALWQAGRLSLDAFNKFGETQDRETGIRLLRALEAQYPTSKLAKQVTDLLERPVGARPARTTGAGDGLAPHVANAETPRLATIKDIQRAVLPDAVRVTIELDAEVPFHEERLADPARVFVDFLSTRAAPALIDQKLRFGDADLVPRIRIGRHPNNTTRVVLDAAGVSSYSVYPLYSPYRLVIDCVRATALNAPSAPSARAAPAPVKAPTAPALLPARRLASDWTRQLPSTSPRAAAEPSDAVVGEGAANVASADVTTPPAATSDPSAAAGPANLPSKNLSGGFSIARQLGLGVSRIVIDPGHGGHDLGAQGGGVTEAELVLDIALRLEKLLAKVEGVEAILTRRTDEFVPLQERTAMANREGADLFLSIHANANSNVRVRGVETYFLNFATTLSAAAVASRENAASGQAMGALPDFVKAIALNNKLDESRDFATLVQRAMVEKLGGANKAIKNLGVKQAPFVVLIGAAMPSVLTEISFVTNPQEARLLGESAYRQRIAEALLNAIRKYQTSLKNVTRVAQQ